MTGSPSRAPAPARIGEVHLEEPLPELPARDGDGAPHRRALILVRLHDVPLGVVEIELADEPLSATEYGRRMWTGIESAVNAHLASDGLPRISALDENGLPPAQEPPCARRRREALEIAPFASVVVPTKNRHESLAICLDSLVRLEYPAFEIVVVDNGAGESAEGLIKARFTGGSVPVRYIRQDGSLAAARNSGAEVARGEIVAYADDDVVVDRWWLLELVRGFLDEQVACVTGMILPFELETAPQIWLEQYGGFNKGFHPRRFDLDDHRPKSHLFPYATGMLGTGANMAFRRRELLELGGFDPAIGPGTRTRGAEDLAAFFDVLAAGYSLVYQPSAFLYHRHRRDYQSLREQAFSYGVGFTAYVTKLIVDRPRRLPDLVWRLPFGLAYLLSPTSRKNVKKEADYPRELTWLELKGMAYGPFAYLLSRWEQKH
jgi:O-antigen biosynthesis protein